MKELEFKKNKKENLFNYLHVDNTSYASIAAIFILRSFPRALKLLSGGASEGGRKLASK